MAGRTLLRGKPLDHIASRTQIYDDQLAGTPDFLLTPQMPTGFNFTMAQVIIAAKWAVNFFTLQQKVRLPGVAYVAGFRVLHGSKFI